MNQFLSNKIIAGIVALALLVGVGVLISSGDTSSTTRNAALVVATPCTKPGQVTKVSQQSVVCATTNTGSLWYATMKAKGKAQPCTKPGAIRQKSKIVWVCGVVKKKKLWQATQPLSALAAKEDLPSTTPATPDAPVVADNALLADPAVIDTSPTQTLAPAVPAALSLVTQPSGGANAAALKTQPVVQLLDQRGASISTAGITITAVSGRTDVVLSGNTAVTDATGRATFKTLSLKGKMGDIALTFTTPGLEGITSDKFVLAAGAATVLVSDIELGAVAAGEFFSQKPLLHFKDSSANVIAVSGVDVVVSASTKGLDGYTTTEGLSGYTTEATAKDGYVLFKDLTLTQTGETTLTFTSGDLSTTSKVVVRPSGSRRLKITTEASERATNDIPLANQPVVQLLDAEGNNAATEGIKVTARITQFPAGADTKTSKLFNSTARTNKDGVATFIGLGITGLIGTYKLGFTPDNGVTQASEKTTTLSAGVATQLTVLTAAADPVGDSTEGKWRLTQPPVIGLRDISNNPVTTSGVEVLATVTEQGPTFLKATDVNGEATFPIIFSGDVAGTRTITYTAANVDNLREQITLLSLLPVVQALELPMDTTTTSRAFTPTAPTSNSNGAWTYTSSKETIATVTVEVTSTGAVTVKVTPTGVAGTTTIRATQAATLKYKSSWSEADLEINLTTPVVFRDVDYLFGKITTSTSFKPSTDPESTNTNGAWVYRGFPTTFATVTSEGEVTPTGVAGTTKITATQAATTKYASATSTATLEINLTTPTVGGLIIPRDKNTWSGNFTLPAPTSNSDGAWTYTSSDTTVAIVTSAIMVRPDRSTYPAATVTLRNVAGTTKITATQAATTKYESSWSEADLVIVLKTPGVTWNIDTSRPRCKCSDPLTLLPPTSNSDGAWTYTSSNLLVATVATTIVFRPDRSTYEVATVTLGGLAGTVTITAIQAETPMYTSTTMTKTLTITDGYSIGAPGPAGGIVFYVATQPFACGEDLTAKCTYLEAALADWGQAGKMTVAQHLRWGCRGTPTGVTATAIGTGKANTTKILAMCPTAGIAARVAADYRGGGKSDWFLPSRDELSTLYFMREQSTIAFYLSSYWSSSEWPTRADVAWAQSFKTSEDGGDYKDGFQMVRPVRAF